jgi:hypothetical protein
MPNQPPSTPKHPGGPCAARRRDGAPCTAPALESGYCFAHDPTRAADRADARAKGGRNRSGVRRARALGPPRLAAVYDRLERALEETHAGELDPKQATAMANLARALAAVLQAGEIEERVRTLEGRGAA